MQHDTPKMKSQSKQYMDVVKVCRRKRKRSDMQEKLSPTIFWHCDSYRLRLEKGKIITGVYYASLSNKLKIAIQAKRSHLAKKESTLVPPS